MKFSLNYRSKHKQEADEIRCPINQLGTIFPFVKDNPDKRYNIIIADNSSIEHDCMIEQIEYVKQVADNYTIQCGDIATFRGLLETGYNAYLRFPVVDWETFQNLQKSGSSDIYIDGPLGFQSSALVKGKKNTMIRVSPTISPNVSLSIDSTNASSFFIRPEDLDKYNGAIDIIDFKMIDQDKEDTLFQIYKHGTFNFNLKELIEGLNCTVPNLFIPSDFAQARLNCGQHCKIPGRGCSLCDTQLSLTNTIVDYFEKSN